MCGHNTGALALCILLMCKLATAWQNPEMVDADHQITLVDYFEWYKLEPTALTVTYDETKLSGKLVFSLFGYSERNLTKISKVQTPFALLSTAAVPVGSNGSLDVAQMGLQCAGKEDECNKYDIGFMQIATEKEKNATRHVALISQIIPLGWFLQKNYLKENFKDWQYGKCTTWSKAESQELQTSMQNVSCPNTMSAAESDPGWFLRSTYMAGFPMEEWRTGNSTAEPSQTCFYSAIEGIPPELQRNTSYMTAAPASMCCYRNSDATLLMKEFMSPGNPRLHGSSVLRSHPFGSDNHPEHYLSGHVPYLSHWYWDKLPYLLCCQWWQGSACANYYLKLRPAPQIRRRPGGSLAAVVTESHVHPLPGAGVSGPTLCPQVGEYWLLRTPTIEVQIRNYVVSSYTGKLPASDRPHYSKFQIAGSKSAFVTAVAMRSLDSPKQVMELVCPEGEFRSYVQATHRASGTTLVYDGNMGRALGKNLMVGDALHSGRNKIYSFLVKNHQSRVGIVAYVVDPGEALMNLYVTVSADLIGNLTGLAAGNGGDCSEHKISSEEERLFSSVCDNCDDFGKYSTGRPLYYEPFTDFDKLLPPVGSGCSSDKICNYITWSTNYLSYFLSVDESKAEIELLREKIGNTGWDVCQRPNILGLYISQDQSFNESATIELKCLEPLKSAAHEGPVTSTCKQSAESLAFDYPKDFVCAAVTSIPAVVIVAEEKAAAADQEYTKKHYSVEAQESKKLAPGSAGPPATLLAIVALALTGILRLF